MKKIEELTEEEIQERVKELDDEINKFNSNTIPKILKILEDEEHGVVVSCYGLVAIVNALINKWTLISEKDSSAFSIFLLLKLYSPIHKYIMLNTAVIIIDLLE